MEAFEWRTARNPAAPGGAAFVPELIHSRAAVVAAQVPASGRWDVVISGHNGTFLLLNHVPQKRPVQAFR